MPGPRGGTWSPSAIQGDRRAQDGILCQELYIGVRVFNRRKFRKHPDTGRRSSVLNPPSEWIREAVPDLRIIDDELWAAVQGRQKALSEMPTAHIRKPKRLLSGLMRCSLCGSAMTLNAGKYNCSGHRERGVCRNNKVIAALTVERRVIEGIRQKLLAPEAIAETVQQQRAAAEAERREILSARAPIEREIAEIERKLARAQEMCLGGAIEIDELKTLTVKHKERRAGLEAKLASVETPGVISLHPAAEAYAALATRLHEVLDEGEGEEARAELGKILERVDFEPREGLGNLGLQVHGKLAALLGVSERAAADPTNCGVRLGAGTGFEPVTFRL